MRKRSRSVEATNNSGLRPARLALRLSLPSGSKAERSRRKLLSSPMPPKTGRMI